MNPILFCDLDGTLLMPMETQFGPEAVAALRLMDDAGWIFVLHSTWRVWQGDEAWRLFDGAGLKLADVIDWGVPAKLKAIKMYLDDNYRSNWPRAVAIDDYPLYDAPPGIETYQVGRYGFTRDDARKILRQENT